jgi:hypothetical protein
MTLIKENQTLERPSRFPNDPWRRGGRLKANAVVGNLARVHLRWRNTEVEKRRRGSRPPHYLLPQAGTSHHQIYR